LLKELAAGVFDDERILAISCQPCDIIFSPERYLLETPVFDPLVRHEVVSEFIRAGYIFGHWVGLTRVYFERRSRMHECKLVELWEEVRRCEEEWREFNAKKGQRIVFAVLTLGASLLWNHKPPMPRCPFLKKMVGAEISDRHEIEMIKMAKDGLLECEQGVFFPTKHLVYEIRSDQVFGKQRSAI
jgi:hypothetical protein